MGTQRALGAALILVLASAVAVLLVYVALFFASTHEPVYRGPPGLTFEGRHPHVRGTAGIASERRIAELEWKVHDLEWKVHDLEWKAWGKEGVSTKGLVFWSSDYHITPPGDVAEILKDFGGRMVDKSLSDDCAQRGTCATDLRVLNKDNAGTGGRCPNQLRRQLYEAYQRDKEMRSVDAFVCSYAFGMCELFMGFGRPIIMLSAIRYEVWREPNYLGGPDDSGSVAGRWRELNKNMERIASKPYNTIAANNVYDQEYIKYFTPINATLLPSLCQEVERAAQYTVPSRVEFLVNSRPNPKVMEQLAVAAKAAGIQVKGLRDLYPKFKYSDLVKHPGLVLIPYTVSFMSAFEYYRMKIPLFVPTPALLETWDKLFHVMPERTWHHIRMLEDEYYKRVPSSFRHLRLNFSSPFPRHPDATSKSLLDPNDENDRQAAREWIANSDWYSWPHIIQFSSWDDLMAKLKSTNLAEVSRKMGEFNKENKAAILASWEDVLQRVAQNRAHRRAHGEPMERTFDQAMAEDYQMETRGDCWTGG